MSNDAADQPKIELRKITRDNYEAVCLLEVHPEQENFVASNEWSIVEASFNPDYVTRAVYVGGEAIGFFMWVPDDPEQPESVRIWRFMIDKHHQRKSYGKKALSLAIEEIKFNHDLKKIEICYDKENNIAKNIYINFGFAELGVDDEIDEMIAVLIL